MNFDKPETSGLDNSVSDIESKMKILHSGFESSKKPEAGVFSGVNESIDKNITNWLDVDLAENTDLSAFRNTFLDTAKQMYSGEDLGDGKRTLGLKDIGAWKINPDDYYKNLKQHSGFSAEVISTAKENMQAKISGSGITTYRVDDLADKAIKGIAKNDQYVDKVRIDSNGNIVERVQVKFVGKNGKECLGLLKSKSFDKYFNDGAVDKMEIPKDYYDDVKQLIPEKIEKFEKQYRHAVENGNRELAEKHQASIDRYNKIDQMIEKSTVTSSEAIAATKHPKMYTAKIFAQETARVGNKAGLESAALSASITACVSTVDNVNKVMEGKITPKEAFVDVTKDTAASGGIAYGTRFISEAVSQTMGKSSSALIRKVGGSCLPAAVVSYAVESYDDISDYAQGKIGGKELAYNLGENAAGVAGGIAGGAVGGIIGGTVGCALATEAYQTAVELGAEGAEIIAEKAQDLASGVVDTVSEVVPEALDDVKNAFSDFSAKAKIKLPF
ncbi:hypothetical protein [Ruminococcus albus]|uniref:hypothetical protein n=1 Tax=Ruminococcus albus TaxID=1264 RepID=UPI0004641218|nr:hypothetical protein [Ruminococcus albus]